MSTELRIVLAIALVIAICLIIRYRRFFELGPGIVLAIAISAAGCANPGLTAVKVADQTEQLQEAVAPELAKRCIDPIATSTGPQLDELQKTCDPVMGLYGAVSKSHFSLRAAIVAYAAFTGASREEFVSTLIRLTVELGVAWANFAVAIGGLK